MELLVIANERNADREYERGLLSCVANNESASQLVFKFLIARGSEFGEGNIPNVTVAVEMLVKLLQGERQGTILNAFRAFAAEKDYYIDFELLGLILLKRTEIWSA